MENLILKKKTNKMNKLLVDINTFNRRFSECNKNFS